MKNRTNIVLTSSPDFKAKGAAVAHSMEELLRELEKYDSRDIYIAGGESVYRQMADLCDTAYITKIEYEYQADAWFPNLDEKEEWELTKDSEEQTYFDLEYYFLKYEKKNSNVGQ